MNNNTFLFLLIGAALGALIYLFILVKRIARAHTRIAEALEKIAHHRPSPR